MLTNSEFGEKVLQFMIIPVFKKEAMKGGFLTEITPFDLIISQPVISDDMKEALFDITCLTTGYKENYSKETIRLHGTFSVPIKDITFTFLSDKTIEEAFFKDKEKAKYEAKALSLLASAKKALNLLKGDKS